MTALSDINAKIVNQRFKELEKEIVELKEQLAFMQGGLGNLQALIDAQTKMIQNVWVLQNGTGGTENE